MTIRIPVPVSSHVRVNERGKLEHVNAYVRVIEIPLPGEKGPDFPYGPARELPEVVPEPRSHVGERLSDEYLEELFGSTALEPQSQGSHWNLDTNPDALTEFAEVPEYVYRAMSEEQFQQTLSTGWHESDSRANYAGQKELAPDLWEGEEAAEEGTVAARWVKSGYLQTFSPRTPEDNIGRVVKIRADGFELHPDDDEGGDLQIWGGFPASAIVGWTGKIDANGSRYEIISDDAKPHRELPEPEPELPPFAPTQEYYRASWDELPDRLYHVAPAEARQAVSEGGLDATGRTHYLAISKHDQEAGGAWSEGFYTGPGSDTYSYRPEGVYTFADAREAVLYANAREQETGQSYDIWQIDTDSLRAAQSDPAHRTDMIRDPELFQSEFEDEEERVLATDDPEEFWNSLREQESYDPDAGTSGWHDHRNWVFQRVHPDHLKRVEPYELKDRERWTDEDVEAHMDAHPEEYIDEDYVEDVGTSPLDYHGRSAERLVTRAAPYEGDHPYFPSGTTEAAFVDYTTVGDGVKIDYLAVRPDQQGQGRARALVDDLYERYPGTIDFGDIMEPQIQHLFDERLVSDPERTRGSALPSRTGRTEFIRPERRVMYHVSARGNRASIKQHGLDMDRAMESPWANVEEWADEGGTFLWQSPEAARDYATGLGEVDVYEVDVTGLDVQPDRTGAVPVEGAWWIADPIPSERVHRVEPQGITKRDLPIHISPTLRSVMADLDAEGHRALIVGGAVRDALLGGDPKDIDVEVYGTDYEHLNEVLSRYGKTNLVGEAFGVLKFTDPEGNEYDFSLPRRDNLVGVGHRGFETEFDPDISFEEAASRRDFTWNALAYDPVSGELHDYFGGEQDLRDKVIRHTSPAFAEDPLRVLRGMQFAARYDMTVAPETAELARSIVDRYDELPSERVSEEFMKLALRAPHPGKGIQFLHDTGWDMHFPALAELWGVPQDEGWHPEGDAAQHTMHAADAAAAIADREGLTGDDRAVVVLGTIVHDVGKSSHTQLAEDTEDGKIHSWGHAEAGGAIAREFLGQAGIKRDIIDRVAPLVEAHMDHVNYQDGGGSPKAIRRLAKRISPGTIQELVWVSEADVSGRPPKPPHVPPGSLRMMELAEASDVVSGAPANYLFGRDVMPYFDNVGGRHIGEVLREAYDLQMDGELNSREEALAWLDDRMTNQLVQEVAAPTWTDPGPHPWSDIDETLPTPPGTPEYEAALDALSQAYEVRRNAREAWNLQMARGVALGAVTPEEADERGWRHDGHADTIEPLPETLYHATSALTPVLANGLKTRAELSSTGLGGGGDDVISFTDDPAKAERIAEVIREAGRVIRGEVTSAELIQRAKDGGFYPMLVDVAAGGSEENMRFWHADQLYRQHTGTIMSLDEVRATYGDADWRPHPDAPGITGGDGQTRHLVWVRSQTQKEQRKYRFEDLYRTFLAVQERTDMEDPEKMDPLFFSPDLDYLANLDPAEVGVVTVHPREGARGYHMGGILGEWRTWSGDAVTVSGAPNAIDSSNQPFAQWARPADDPQWKNRRWFHATNSENFALDPEYAVYFGDEEQRKGILFVTQDPSVWIDSFEREYVAEIRLADDAVPMKDFIVGQGDETYILNLDKIEVVRTVRADSLGVPSEVVPARRANYPDVETAESDIRQRFGYADLSGLVSATDLDTLNDILDQVYRIIEEYPQIMEGRDSGSVRRDGFDDGQFRFRGIGTYAADSTPPNVSDQAGGAWGTTAVRGPRIESDATVVPAPLHPTQLPDQAGTGPYVWVDPIQFNDYFSVLTAPDTPAGAMVHEMGHVVAYIGDRSNNGYARTLAAFRRARYEAYQADSIKNQERQWMRDTDSIYSAMNEDEGFAELFYLLNFPGALDVVKSTGKPRSAAAKRRLLRIRAAVNAELGIKVL